MTHVFRAVGEHRADPYRLLLLGDDGAYYEQRLPDGAPAPAEPDRQTWRFDDEPRPAERRFEEELPNASAFA